MSKWIMLKKPYLIDPYRSISMKEAQKLWLLSGYHSAEELLRNAVSLASDKEVKERLEKLLRKFQIINRQSDTFS